MPAPRSPRRLCRKDGKCVSICVPSGVPPVPGIQEKAAHSKKTASPIFSGTSDPELNHTEKPISNAYPVIDNDLARDNVENDIPAADLEDI